MADRLKRSNIAHLLDEHAVERVSIEDGFAKEGDDLAFRVGIHYVGQFNELARILGGRAQRGERTEQGVQMTFNYKGWTFYTYLPEKLTKTQKVKL